MVQAQLRPLGYTGWLTCGYEYNKSVGGHQHAVEKGGLITLVREVLPAQSVDSFSSSRFQMQLTSVGDILVVNSYVLPAQTALTLFVALRMKLFPRSTGVRPGCGVVTSIRYLNILFFVQ